MVRQIADEDGGGFGEGEEGVFWIDVLAGRIPRAMREVRVRGGGDPKGRKGKAGC